MVGESGTSQSGKVYHYYKCVTAKKKGGCHRKALRKDAIEKLVMRKTVQSVFECNAMDSLVEHLMMWQAKENTAIPLLQRELQEVEKSLENMARAIEQGIINPTTKRRMDELTEQKTDLEVKIAREEIQTQILTREQVKFWLSKMIDLNLASQDNKQRIIDTFVNSIYVHDDRVIINFNCREESETIPLKLSTYVSDLRGLGEPPHRTIRSHSRKASFQRLTSRRTIKTASLAFIPLQINIMNEILNFIGVTKTMCRLTALQAYRSSSLLPLPTLPTVQLLLIF